MKAKNIAIGAAFVAAVGAGVYWGHSPTISPVPGTKAGVERWAIKTMSDPDVAKVEMDRIVDTDITTLAALPVPKFPNGFNVTPRFGEELKTYRVIARAVACKLEADGDYHLILTNGTTEIGVEIPTPDYAIGSVVIGQLEQTRRQFAQMFGASTKVDTQYRKLPGTMVEVVGIGFWDREHGQRGAKNGVELHPVLSITEAPKGKVE